MKEKELCRLIGYLLGDASVKIKKRYKRQGFQTELSIESTSLSIVKDFRNLCKQLVARKVGRITERIKRKNWRKSYIFSCKINKKLSTFLFKFSSFRKKDPSVKIPEIIYKDTNNTINFLQALTNSEGSVCLIIHKNRKWWALKRYVKISNKNPNILKSIKKSLDILGIESKLWPKKKPIGVIIQGNNSVLRFKELVNFMKGIKISSIGIWRGFEKHQLLNLLLKSYHLRRGKLQKFETKKDVYNFLKNL